ncbi:unnamed protein product [Strongylus vulgaris]|uniref:Uncharacterized protein n=1 Tax=Strongylus vulgaris TaxID=40348 RepID=A0A3P7L189_STRVU|nr:unnamed protein product [Strongylus vulgaris]
MRHAVPPSNIVPRVPVNRSRPQSTASYNSLGILIWTGKYRVAKFQSLNKHFRLATEAHLMRRRHRPKSGNATSDLF